MKGEHLLRLNYTCDCVPSGSLTYINTRRMHREKVGVENKMGPLSSSKDNNVVPKKPRLHRCPDPTASKSLSWPPSPSSSPLRQRSVKIRLHHLLALHPLPLVPEAGAVTTAPRDSMWHLCVRRPRLWFCWKSQRKDFSFLSLPWQCIRINTQAAHSQGQTFLNLSQGNAPRWVGGREKIIMM